eukprot:gnl/MRDRNA2_/MRDRNA2_79862_c0_seq2.p1 gnl/MRDRNA2_/MRDRNA2_79862_c0~~gnl/MRDRNA2_/MRDRNA2_79862_c0_seq2.p1  ORF type:complete len:538 (+),score=117.88 gnl/MRDRNA2_/MRDRNA2_79862_c0_seq2:80-1615(+)
MAPLQLTITWALCVINLAIKAIYVSFAILSLLLTLGKGCGRADSLLVGGTLSDGLKDVGLGTENLILSQKTWMRFDICFQILSMICLVPQMQLARQAMREVQRPEATYTDINDPYQCFKDVIMDDTTYYSFGCYRYDQVMNSRAHKVGRWLGIIDFFWCVLGSNQLFEVPMAYCGSKSVLYMIRIRMMVFLMLAGTTAVQLLIDVLQAVMDGSDQAYAWLMRTAADFDREYAVMGLPIPIVTALARLLVSRDSSDPQKSELRILQNEKGYLNYEQARLCKERQHMEYEEARVDQDIERLQILVDSYTQKERAMQKDIEDQLQKNLYDFGQSGAQIASDAFHGLEESNSGLAATLKMGEQIYHEAAEDPEAFMTRVHDAEHALEAELQADAEWLASADGREQLGSRLQQQAMAGAAALEQQAHQALESESARGMVASASSAAANVQQQAQEAMEAGGGAATVAQIHAAAQQTLDQARAGSDIAAQLQGPIFQGGASQTQEASTEDNEDGRHG